MVRRAHPAQLERRRRWSFGLLEATDGLAEIAKFELGLMTLALAWEIWPEVAYLYLPGDMRPPTDTNSLSNKYFFRRGEPCVRPGKVWYEKAM